MSAEESVSLPEPSPGERIMIVEMDVEDLPQVTVEGVEKHSGMTLKQLLDQVGGYRGKLTHPFTDEEIPVSLEKWRDRDPDKVWLYVAFVDPME